MALWTPQVQVSLALTKSINQSRNAHFYTCGVAALMASSSLRQVQGARGRLLAAAADSLRERGADRAANEGETKQASGGG